MVFRIDYKHFLTHMIDYFTYDELLHFEYLIISAKLQNGASCKNVAKRVQFYPTVEITESYILNNNKEALEEMYMDMLFPKDNPKKKLYGEILFYQNFVNPLLQHQDIVIICDGDDENDYVDIICKILKKRFSIEVIDLNKLFSSGKINPIKFDRDKIWDKAVDVRRESVKQEWKEMETTADGRRKLLNKLTKKAKVEKLEEMGVKVNKSDKKSERKLDRLLTDAWASDDPEE